MKLARRTIAVPDTAADDPRVGRLLGTALEATAPPRVSIVGFAVDQGIERNGGRVGAREGPTALREMLYRMTPDPRAYDAWLELLAHTRDLGDVVGTGDLERDQAALGEVVGAELEKNTFVIVLGGGHETSYAHFLGYVQAQRRVAIQNIDAHADVRPLKRGFGHSGSPFRQILEHPSGLCAEYAVSALQSSAVARAHLAYLDEKGGKYGFRQGFDAARLYAPSSHAQLATFCLDAVDQAFAPGVSAPSIDGLTVSEWLAAAYRAGSAASVTSVDVVELSPRFDRDGQTARLAARTVWEILRGFAARA